MGRRSESLNPRIGGLNDVDGENGVIQVVARAFDVLRCFSDHNARIGNMEIAQRCSLPRSTVSRLTHTLTRMGLLTYLPNDQKYRLGPGAVAMSATILQGMQFRSLVRARLQDVAERIPGTVGFVVPDKFDMVYLECARTYNAVGLHSTVGTRIHMARSAAGLAYVSALPEAAAETLMLEMEQVQPRDARQLRARIAQGRKHLRQKGYVVSRGVWNEHIVGCSVPLWSEQYRAFLVVTVGVLCVMYDDRRVHREIAPQMLELARGIETISGCFGEEVPVGGSIAETFPANEETATQGKSDELEARAGRTEPAKSLRSGNGRARQGQAPARLRPADGARPDRQARR
jgi:DNA-binding IclR family transcriptional regulator